MTIPTIIFFPWKMFYWTFGLTLTLIVLPLLIFIKVAAIKYNIYNYMEQVSSIFCIRLFFYIKNIESDLLFYSKHILLDESSRALQLALELPNYHKCQQWYTPQLGSTGFKSVKIYLIMQESMSDYSKIYILWLMPT